MATLEAEAGSEPVATAQMCAYAFDVLWAHFGRLEEPVPAFDTTVACPLFVTLNTLTRRGRSLRGCIGSLSPRPLAELKDYTFSSAFRDRRFQPLAESEIPTLEIGISLLVKYEKGEHCLDWEVGKHGIIIEFRAGGQRYSATYLPEVAQEQSWTQREAIESLIRKAGCRDRISDSLLESIALTRYQSSKCKLSYDEYIVLRQPFQN